MRAHALVNLGLVIVMTDPGNQADLLHAVSVADQAGEHHEASRALLGLAFTLMESNRLDEATEVSARALAYAQRHEVHALSHYIVAMQARIDVLAGRWADVESRVSEVVNTGGTVPGLLALTALALLQVRRGDPEAAATLAQAWEDATSADELQRIAPLAEAEAERAWLAGELTPDSPHLQACYQELRVRRPLMCGQLARWLQEAGYPVEVHDPLDEPFRLELAGEWEAAARVWAGRDMPYDQAFCLAHTPTGTDRAIAVAEALGARPLVARIKRQSSRSTATT